MHLAPEQATRQILDILSRTRLDDRLAWLRQALLSDARRRNASYYRRRHHFQRAVEEWAQWELHAADDPDFETPVFPLFQRFSAEHPQAGFGLRVFYDALRQAGYPVAYPGRSGRAVVRGYTPGAAG